MISGPLESARATQRAGVVRRTADWDACARGLQAEHAEQLSPRSSISFTRIVPAVRIGSMTFSQRGELRQQEVKLENKAALHQPHIRPFVFRKFRGRLAANDDLALGRRIEQAEQIKQRRLARAGRPGDREELALCDREIDAVNERVRDRPLDAPHQSDGLQSDRRS